MFAILVKNSPADPYDVLQKTLQKTKGKKIDRSNLGAE